jgi:glyoxylase-like metal-dependent hydrolase (beta-lactamase superfamily II)
MVQVSPVTQDIFHFHLPAEKLTSVFSAYLVREGDSGALIEPGPAAIAPGIVEGFKQVGFDPSRLAYIIPTHIHLDHGGGSGYLAQRFPQAKVVVHPDGKRHTVDPTRLIASTRMAFGDDFEDAYGPILPVPEERLLVPEDGQAIRLGERELRVVYSPGHASHHLSVYDSQSGCLFSGESLGVPAPGTQTPVPHAAPPGFDLEVYLDSMEKQRALKPKLILYSHGEVGRDPDRLITAAAENSRAFGDIVLTALKAGEDEEQIGQRIREYMKRATGIADERSMFGMTMAGYTFYYRKRGLA